MQFWVTTALSSSLSRIGREHLLDDGRMTHGGKLQTNQPLQKSIKRARLRTYTITEIAILYQILANQTKKLNRDSGNPQPRTKMNQIMRDSRNTNHNNNNIYAPARLSLLHV